METMPKHDPKDLSVDLMINYIARGHGFNKHVLGKDPEPSMSGINCFRSSVDNVEREIKGDDLKIETPDDLAHYLNRMIDDRDTIGFRNQQGAITLYNTEDNVIAHFTPGGKKTMDFGSVYRYAESAQKYETYITQPGNQITDQFDNTTNPGSVRAGLETLAENIRAKPKDYMKAVNVQHPKFEAKVLACVDRPGRGWTQDEISNAVNNIHGHSQEYAEANNLGIAPENCVRIEDHTSREIHIKAIRQQAIAHAESTGHEMTYKFGHDIKLGYNLRDLHAKAAALYASTRYQSIEDCRPNAEMAVEEDHNEL